MSLNPSYFCNLRCNFCYLTEEQLSDQKTISLQKTQKLLTDILKRYGNIDNLDIYGGEIFLLKRDYLVSLLDLLQEFKKPPFNIITNLTHFPPLIEDERVYVSVSYDFEAREQHEKVFKNMALLEKKFSILILASPQVISQNVDNLISQLNLLNHLQSVEIKPYSTNQANQYQLNDKDFSEFVKKWIQSPIKKNFILINEERILNCLDRSYSAFSDDHIYITPSGNFAVLEFDSNGNEFFLELDNLDEYEKWTNVEKQKIEKNRFCSSCRYKGHCLTEHYREVSSLENDCNGFFSLLEWYNATVL